MGRTTTAWLRYVRKTGRGTFQLPGNSVRSPLENVVGLDWGAVPELFEALDDKRTRFVAESILGKYKDTGGQPLIDDLEAGLKSSSDRVRLWSIRLLTNCGDAAQTQIPVLCEIRDQGPEELAAAAVETLEQIGQPAPAEKVHIATE